MYYLITSVLFIAGLTIFILHHYVTNSKSLTEGTKSEILEKQENQKLFYSKVIAICLAITLIISAMGAFIPSNTEEYDPNKCYWCEGSGMYEDAYGKLHYCSHCHGSGRQ
jgi:DnaJ-class molecular chaperone